MLEKDLARAFVRAYVRACARGVWDVKSKEGVAAASNGDTKDFLNEKRAWKKIRRSRESSLSDFSGDNSRYGSGGGSGGGSGVCSG